MKKLITWGCLLAFLSCLSALVVRGQDQRGIDIMRLSPTNTMVKVHSGSKYLLLPVQDSADESTLHIIADGRTERTLTVRLAMTKVDDMVPLDISEYLGDSLLLNVITSSDSSKALFWSNLSLSDAYDATNREKYRPAYHHTPLYGWMNDPNGMFYKDGVWHLCYQWNPYGSKWQNLSWGHSTSRDLIHWEHHTEVLRPDGLGMIFSGSSAVDTDNSTGFGAGSVIALYTSAAASQVQSMAYSTDGGYSFTTYSGNPVLTMDSEARDPKVLWDADRKQWTMVLAHALEKEMLIFSSPNMREWTLESAFGKGLGAQGGVWECPDLFPLPVSGTDETKWVLLCNINPGGPFGGSATQYFVGDFDGKHFIPDRDAHGEIPTKWMDYGKDHYATVSWSDAPDGRRMVVGWMSNWQYAAEVPTLQYRSANTLPRDLSLFRGADGEYYLASTPSPELDSLRDKLTYHSGRLSVGKRPRTVALPSARGGICEIVAEIDARSAGSVTLSLLNEQGEEVRMTYDVRGESFSVDRTRSGLVDFSPDFPCVTSSPTFSDSGKLSLRIFVDRSSVEVFEGSGRFVQTNIVFPTSPYTTLQLKAEGEKVRISDLRIYSIKD